MRNMRRLASSMVLIVFAGGGLGSAKAAPSFAPAAPVPLTPSGSWLQPETVAEGEIDADSADFDIDRTSGIAAWRVLDDGIWRVQVAERDGPGSWTSPVIVSGTGVATETPRVARLFTSTEYDDVSYEHLVAVWRAFDGANWRIQYAVKLVGRPGWSTPKMLSGAGQDAADPVVDNAYGYTGESWIDVTWRRFNGAHWRVATKAVTGSGASSVPDYLSPPGYDVRDLTNHPLVAWTQWDGTNWRAQVAPREDRGGYLLPGHPVSPVGEDAFEPKVSYGAAVWRTYDGSNWRVRGTTSREYLSWRTPISLSPAGADAEAPEVVTCGDPFFVAWRQFDTANWRVAWRGYDGGWSPMSLLSPAGRDASLPAIEAMRRYDCEFATAWTEPEGTHEAVKATDLSDAGASPVVTTLSGVDVAVQGVAVVGPIVAWLDGTATPKGLRMAILDKLGPEANMWVPTAQNGQPRPAVWWAHDDWSKIAGFDVNERVIRWNSPEWIARRLFTNTAKRSWSGPFRPGRTYCFRVRARDTAGNIGPWSYRLRCTVTPIDDRRLVRTGHWAAHQGSRYFQGTYLRTRQQGATLSLHNLTGVQRVGVLVATGPGNGRIRLSFSGFLPRVIDLDTPTRKWLVVPRLISWAPYRAPGRLKVTVLSEGKPVRIDGVFVGKR